MRRVRRIQFSLHEENRRRHAIERVDGRVAEISRSILPSATAHASLSGFQPPNRPRRAVWRHLTVRCHQIAPTSTHHRRLESVHAGEGHSLRRAVLQGHMEGLPSRGDQKRPPPPGATTSLFVQPASGVLPATAPVARSTFQSASAPRKHTARPDSSQGGARESSAKLGCFASVIGRGGPLVASTTRQLPSANDNTSIASLIWSGVAGPAPAAAPAAEVWPCASATRNNHPQGIRATGSSDSYKLVLSAFENSSAGWCNGFVLIDHAAMTPEENVRKPARYTAHTRPSAAPTIPASNAPAG